MPPIHRRFPRLAAALAMGLLGATADAASPLDTATVTFGSWMSSPPVDRFPNTSNTRFLNHHVVTPNVVKIKAGGTVNFIVSGLHNIAVYDDGTLPEDIDTTQVVNTTGTPNDIPVIDDAANRIYRGLDPTTQPVADRVEAVRFDAPGTYLVICGLRPHFTAGMYGYVVVVP